MAGHEPKLHVLAFPAPALKASSMFVWRIDMLLADENRDFIRAIQERSREGKLCDKGARFFDAISFSVGGNLWVLHTDDTVKASNAAPQVVSVLALLISDEDEGSLAYRVEFFCATLGSPKGAGKLLFDAVAKHAAACGYKFITLNHTGDEVAKKVYTDLYGMRCSSSECVLVLRSYPQVRVPLHAIVSLQMLRRAEETLTGTLPPFPATFVPRASVQYYPVAELKPVPKTAK